MVFVPAIDFFSRIDPDVEVVEEQVVVGAVASVLAAQDVGAGRRLLGRHGRRRRRLAAARAGAAARGPGAQWRGKRGEVAWTDARHGAAMRPAGSDRAARPGLRRRKHAPYLASARPSPMRRPRRPIAAPRRLAVTLARVKLTVTVITLNEAAHIEAALASVAWADEIIVVDSGSTDGTVENARPLATRVEAARLARLRRAEEPRQRARLARLDPVDRRRRAGDAGAGGRDSRRSSSSRRRAATGFRG